MTYFGLFFALIPVLAGLIIFRWPHLCTSFSAMTPEQLKNVDLKAVSRDSLVILGGTGAACAILYYSLYYTGHYTIAIELCVIADRHAAGDRDEDERHRPRIYPDGTFPSEGHRRMQAVCQHEVFSLCAADTRRRQDRHFQYIRF